MRRLALALLLVAGCARSSPAAAVRALADAARDGDADAVWKRLGPRTRARLAADARQAAATARRDLDPKQLLGLGWTPARFPIDEVREIDDHTVEIEGPHGERERVEVVRESDAWKVELP